MNAQSFKEMEKEKPLSGLSLNEISEIDKQMFITKRDTKEQIEEMVGGSVKRTMQLI